MSLHFIFYGSALRGAALSVFNPFNPMSSCRSRCVILHHGLFALGLLCGIVRLLSPHSLIHVIHMVSLIDLIPQLRNPDLDLRRRPWRRSTELR